MRLIAAIVPSCVVSARRTAGRRPRGAARRSGRACRRAIKAGSPCIAFHSVADDRQARLAVAEDEQVDEGGEQLGVLGAGPAGDHQRVVRPAVLGVERDAAEVEHRQDVGVADLVLEREAQHVEPAQRREGFEAVERQASRAQRGLEVGQRRERPLAGPVAAVHQAVEHLEPVVAHPQGVGVGKGQADRAARGAMVLARRCSARRRRTAPASGHWARSATTWSFNSRLNIVLDSATTTQGPWARPERREAAGRQGPEEAGRLPGRDIRPS